MKFDLNLPRLYILAAFVLTNLFGNTVPVHAAFVPPLYCMGMGANCTGAPAPSLPAYVPEEHHPCTTEPEQTDRGLLANIVQFFYSFFNPHRGDDGPCPENGTTSAVQGDPIHSISEQTSSQIQFVDHQIVQVNGKDMFINVPKLNNTEPGDILVAMIGSDYAHVDTAPPGWVTIRQDVKNAGHTDDLAMQSYYKIVTSDEESNYTWNLVTGRDDTPSSHQPLIAVDLDGFRGVDPNDPIFSSNAHGETEDPQAIECPSAGGIAGGMLLCSYIGDDPGPIVAPGSMTQTSNFEIAGGDSYAIAYEELTSNGDTGSRIAAWDNPGRNKNGSLKSGSDFAHAIVLRPIK